ncbi:MAG: ABC transporter permease [Rhizobiaceae bacterium]|nr:ABC transporter permease [Rhizobiaceae bacterium]
MGPIPKLILKRFGTGLLTLFLVSIVIFFAIVLLPGDAAQQLLGQSATPETLAALREQLGLNQPAVLRYVHWLAGVATGDFGMSIANQRPVGELIGGRLENTLFLAAYAAALAIPLSIVLGLLAALWRNSIFDRLSSLLTLTSISFPEFFVAYILILYFAVRTALFPSLATIDDTTSFLDRLYICFLPAVTLTLVIAAHMMRMTRAAIINLLASAYIETARLKGVSRLRVIARHALPNALAPIVTVVSLNLAYLVTGVLVVEVVFVYPGLGQLLVDSAAKRDLAVVQACCLIFAGIYILLNMVADIIAIATNPRLLHPH